MKKLLTLTFLFMANIIIFGQTPYCGTKAPVNYNTFNRTKAARGYDISNLHTFHMPICINIYYHIVRESDGSDGFDINKISDITDNLNAAYNPHEIYFNKIGIDEINNSALFASFYYYLNNDPSKYNTLVTTNNHPEAINIYIVDNDRIIGVELAGLAVGHPSNAFAVAQNFALESTSPHEMGHCLNLLHTHDTRYGTENIPRTGTNANCNIAGDLLCDTPADPGLSPNNLDSNCNYTGGNGYHPDTRNFMSYSPVSCTNHFSNGQELRMRDAIAGSPILQNVLSSECSLSDISGPYNFCTNQTVSFTINDVYAPINWTTSSNLQIVSGQGSNTITVKAINNQAIGNGLVTVSYYSGKSKKNVYVGSINEGFDSYVIMDDSPVIRVLTNDEGTEIQWRVNGFNVYSDPNDFWMDIDLRNYSDYCTNNQTTVSVRVNKNCGWSLYDNRYYECEEEPLILYPNSSDLDFLIDLSHKPSGTNHQIELYNSNQELRYQGNSENVEKIINTLNLQNGIYYLRVISNGKVKTKQVIIQH